MHRIRIPTPFDVGPVNCYIVSGGAGLVDPGPATEAAYEALTTGLARRGCALSDVEHVLVTHEHMDHCGLASRVATEAGARVVAHADARARLEEPTAYLQREREILGPIMLSMGVPEHLVDSVVDRPRTYLEAQRPVTVDDGVRDGEPIDVGIDLRAVHTPGHTPGSVSYAWPSGDVAFTGDHLLCEITPNPLLSIAPDEPDERTRSLPAYLSSLRKLQSLAVTVGCGGHRERIPDLHRRADEIRSHHRAREERIAEVLRERGPTTAYDVMCDVFPDVSVKMTFSAMSEVVGHLDLLEDEERVAVSSVNGRQLYSIS